MSGQQLTLPFRLNEKFTFENFIPGENKLALSHLKSKLYTSTEWFYYIWGPTSVGRSHLLQACCHHAYQQQKSSIYLPLEEFASKEHQYEMLENLEHVDLICVDDIFLICGDTAWEKALFNLFNRCHEKETRLIVSANQPATSLPIQLADLQSRLSHGLSFHLKPLNDTQKLEVLQIRAIEQGMKLSDECANYLLAHKSRDLKQLFLLLQKLERASLQYQRRITIPFIKTVLDTEC